ncbi:MAG TPA: phosphoribosylanthranilate isomerase [Candidatus Omnitrophota bacterium]|nr:phosphoribosylanthranilate isomerase [Candidatus Omnitrophota bacterium]HNQ50520.1 phosphoribosylanthranilate isomerase [Candidatus Omnitrophota bacterium]HQO38079.1 phosphoribosylanthranilate isomerase [Candidatus Omnitrophota bacterium]HQQ06111.1 phosphoribosylanthranilate isomerase [Candidatus Omnitrophota bacterium]
MVKVKICGITSFEDAAAAVKAGADAIGFVFYRKSPRYVVPGRAAQIARRLPARVKKVGVFVNASPLFVKRCARLCGLDMAQLHGSESPSVCGRCRPVKIIKAFRVRDAEDIDAARRYRTYGYLFDAYVPGSPGGTGKALDRRLLDAIRRLRVSRTIFLSGGLSARSVAAAARAAHPHWVDASSSLESRPGKKDSRKMTAFIRAVKRMSVIS